ncbi:hypothetical protein BDP27DRAFT_1226414 [Rhodocollybia butyracea]|uniref:AMP-dependent synthetase/ligase domain-containing protein n=1 Tax=Rhodocollybia butyracea TaxID=206335 RepID=A0A9P5PS06_9AGAR|nr:hypothetical protein BDP27DRAFT_1226414 [Rhodocollybia butyracea]
MAPQIYKPTIPDVPIVQHSLYSHLFPETPKFPADLPAYVDSFTGTALTRATLEDLALKFAQGLITKKKVKRGDTIMVFAQNSLCWPVVVFGAIAAGLRVTFAPPISTPDELKHLYLDSSAYVICTALPHLRTVIKMLQNGVAPSIEEGERRTIILPDDFNWIPGTPKTRAKNVPGLTTFTDILGFGKLEKPERFDGVDAEQETAFLCYSAGGPGQPKGVQTTHQNVTTVLDMISIGFPILKPESDRMLAVLPFHDMYGLVKLLLFPFMCGISTIVMGNFDPIKFCEAVQQYKATVTLVVPPALVALSTHDSVKEYDLSSLRVIFSGTSSVGGDLVKTVKNRIRPTNAPALQILQGYGLTETTWGTLSLNDESKYGSVGTLLPNLEARLIVDDRNGKAKTDDEVVDAKEGEQGEIWVRGRSVMKGYLNNPEANTKAFHPHTSPPPTKYTPGSQWFKTGDVGVVDRNGFFSVIDRKNVDQTEAKL